MCRHYDKAHPRGTHNIDMDKGALYGYRIQYGIYGPHLSVEINIKGC